MVFMVDEDRPTGGEIMAAVCWLILGAIASCFPIGNAIWQLVK